MNRTTQIESIDLWQMSRQLNGKRIDFSVSHARTSRHPHAKKKKNESRHPHYTLYKN